MSKKISLYQLVGGLWFTALFTLGFHFDHKATLVVLAVFAVALVSVIALAAIFGEFESKPRKKSK